MMTMAEVLKVMQSESPQAGKDAADVERLRAQLDKLARPCGCKSGAALTVLALVGWPIRVVTEGVPHTPLRLVAALVTYALVVLAAAIVGKVAGIVVGRVRRRWYRRRLSSRLSIPAAALGG
jgi:hypothetical protein